MAKKLKTQLQNSKEIKDVLKEHKVKFSLSGEELETLLVYLPCKDGLCDYTGFLEIIKKSILTNFALSCFEIEEKLSIKCDKAPEELFKKSVHKISQHTAQGELGELLLFTLLDVYFEAPKILSKISLKTSRKMPVFGTDAVHAQYVDGELRLYFGESKLHKSFSNASSEAVKSISTSFENYIDDFYLIDTHLDFPEIDTEIRNEMKGILNPYTQEEKLSPDFLHAPCFIGFVDPNIFSDDETIYLEQYVNISKKHIGSFYSKLTKKGNDINKTTLMLLPFSSMDSLVSEFISYMGIEK